CNYDKMLSTTIRSAFANQGQICLCGSRIYVQKGIYEKFKKDFVERVSQLKVGNPHEKSTDQGALVSKAHMEKVLSYIQLAKEEGGQVLCGGEHIALSAEGLTGWLVAPNVIEGLDLLGRTNQEEICGPVVTSTPFATEDEVLTYA